MLMHSGLSRHLIYNNQIKCPMNTLMNNSEGMYIGYLNPSASAPKKYDHKKDGALSPLKRSISGKITPEHIKFSIKLKNWFEWQITVNNEKGTAGGNMKLDLPVRSPIGLALICMGVSVLCAKTCITAYLVPFIFASFAAYHFAKWCRSLQEKLENGDPEREVAPESVRIKK
jgi:hypothetical protein